jgi:mono/diheme cytochrome c family protein
MKKWIARACGVVLIAAIGMAAFLFWPAGQESVTASAAQPTGAALVARGEYLAKAGDCVACHTAPGGQPFAGGLAFRLPFGTIWSSNLTPDRETGIGAWTDAEFVRALHRGIGRNGENLYPAFPYTAYALLSTDDALAIRAWLATLPPARATAPANDLSFPFNQRYLLRIWNVLFLPPPSQPPDTAKGEAWNRGAYLVEGLGHCGECHTPRNVMFGLDQRRKFAGAKQNGWLAYNLTADSGHGLGGWSDAQLEQYLAAGHADGHGSASGPMAEVVENSLRYLSPDDVHAMVVWLRGVPAQPDGPPAGPPEWRVTGTDTLGSRLFAQACAGCHLPSGDGRQSPWAALRGSRTASDPAGTNLVQVLTHGTQIRTSQGLAFMHPFTGAYTDEELAALANYTIGQFGHRPGTITPDQIRRQRGSSAGQEQARSTVVAAGVIRLSAAR